MPAMMPQMPAMMPQMPAMMPQMAQMAVGGSRKRRKRHSRRRTLRLTVIKSES